MDPFEGIRLGGIKAKTQNWWDECNLDDDEMSEQEEDQDMKYLEHHGVLFPPFYKKHNIPLLYDGKKIELNEEQEELCTYWSQTIGTLWDEKDIYRKNFQTLMQTKFEDFQLDKCDFSLIRQYLDQQRELRLNRSEEVKKQEKADKEYRDKIYGFALVDGCLERVGNYTLEPPTLFKGRGEHPKAGLLKGRIMPEDLSINLTKQAPVPKCILPGHSWGNIAHRTDVTWLVSYVDSSIRKDNHKYVQFAATSRFKQMNDKKKYEKARVLKSCIDNIRSDYRKKLVSDELKKRQIGTATYLIDILALRVGNEKEDDEADTVGCCSLRVEHIEIKDEDKIVFDFLGKDSMRYYNEVQLDHQVWKNIKSFQRNKNKDENLFDCISADDLNEYLKTQMKGLTAKVFRTYNASHTLQQQLDKLDLKDIDNVDLEKKVDYYDDANKQVAILCNHQKTIPKSYEQTKQKLTTKIDIMQSYIEELNKHAQKLKKHDMQEYEEEVELGEDSKKKKQVFVKKFPNTREKTLNQMQKMEQKLAKEQKALTKKEEIKEVALGTSKTNYNDPRISVAWCKQHDVPIEKVFPKTLRNKFIWAMSTDPSWKF